MYSQQHQNICTWTNWVSAKGNIKNEEKDTYRRFEETHIQKAHDPLKLTKFLEDIGFKNINVYSDFDISPGYNNECQRVFISCNK